MRKYGIYVEDMLSFSSYVIFYAPQQGYFFSLNSVLLCMTLTPRYASLSYAMFSGQSRGHISGYCCSIANLVYCKISTFLLHISKPCPA